MSVNRLLPFPSLAPLRLGVRSSYREFTGSGNGFGSRQGAKVPRAVGDVAPVTETSGEDLTMSNNRKYGKGLAFVEAGFTACWCNADDLIRSADILLNGGFHAPALSLSVLALEEMGKLFLIDGLLYAKSDDHKSEYFQKGLRSHNIKLAAVTMISSLGVLVASSDPRFKKEDTFKIALRIGHENWKSARQKILDISGESDFQFLDAWKQNGFYVSLVNGNTLQQPKSAIDRSVVDAVYQFAEMSKKNLDFSLGNGNLQRHIERARLIRSKLTENAHIKLEEAAEALCIQLFADQDYNAISN